MTPLIRETVKWSAAVGMDPVELQWFDISGLTTARFETTTDVLMECNPPFGKCVVAYRGPSRSHASYDMLMLVVGDNAKDGIVVDMWKGPTGIMPRKVPTMLYTTEGDMVMYGPTEEADQVPEEEARLVLGIIAKWYQSMLSGGQAYQPFVRQSFTNRRKIAEGKLPTYDWRTVRIEPVKPRSEHQGGTHASPRQHDRRGHLRRLKSGKTCWVKACKVGDPTKGAVFHDYEVRA
jgi:hypothetical protein